MEIYRDRRGFPWTCEDFLSSPGTSAVPKDLRCRRRKTLPAEEILTSGETAPNICICKEPARGLVQPELSWIVAILCITVLALLMRSI